VIRGRVLVDTGPLVALQRRTDQHHEICVRLSRNISAPLFTCWPVITEAMWLLRDSFEEQQRLLETFDTGLVQLLHIDESAVPSVRAMLDRYRSLHPQLADLCLVYLADREAIQTIFTLDRRDFRVYRYRGRSAFRLLPEM
jgi:predicted nucleic acid-binding protein